MSLSVLRRRAASAASALLKSNAPACGQVRGIISKEMRDPNYKRVAPWPYMKKEYTLFQSLFDDVTQRFDENSKIIVVDGPPTGNKEGLARHLAEELDMLYIEDANLDDYYVDSYGVDLRQLNPKVPPIMRSFDIHEFLQRPNHPLTTEQQQKMLMSRFDRYIRAMRHIFNTGQGVVCHRSVYSSIAFEKTLLDFGWISKDAYQYFNDMRGDAMFELLRPHVVVYCDMEPQTVLDNVNKRLEKGEKDSPFYTPEVIGQLIHNYKDLVIKPLSAHAEVLVYDWNTGDVDHEAIVDDICDIDFDQYKDYHEKMSDWVLGKEIHWKERRGRFNHTNGEKLYDQLSNVPYRDIPELFICGEDVLAYEYEREKLASQKYRHGFNKEMGDKLPWWGL